MPHSNPIRVMPVTPAEARKWLAFNTHNRPVSQIAVDKYRSDMIAGRWQFAGDPIRFDVEGRLLDGQHRLHALATCPDDVTLDLLIISKLPADTQTVMDQGRRRTPGDQLGLLGVRNAVVAGAGIRLFLAHESGLMFRDSHAQSGITTTRIERWYIDNAELADAAIDVPFLTASDAPPSVAMCAALLFTDRYGLAKATEFFRLLHAGAGEGHPINTLDKRLQRYRRERIKATPRDTLALFIQAMNYWLDGQTITRFQMPRGAKWTADNYPRLRVLAGGAA